MEIFIGLAVSVMIIILIMVIYKIMRSKHVSKSMEELSETYEFTYETVKKDYDFKIIKDDKTYLMKLCYIPANSCVTINAKDTFCLTYGGKRNDLGKVYPNKRYLNELVKFIRMETDEKKVIVFYPTTEKILKYLNESDIGIVKTEDLPYGMKVVRFSDLFEKMNDIF